MTDSDTDDTSPAVLKRDAQGRVRRTSAQRAELLAAFERSGLSGPAFARIAGINYQTLATWRQQAKSNKQRRPPNIKPRMPVADAPSAIRLIEVALDQSGPHGGAALNALHVHLPGGTQLVIQDASQVSLAAQLIKALA